VLDDLTAARLHRRARAERWDLSVPAFAAVLSNATARAFANEGPAARHVEAFFESLHLEDLALATACAEGREAAWDHFVREYRPILYRAADAMAPGGSARELADALYADLFGLADCGTPRQSLFRYYSGRSSLATWLRAVLAQRHVDRIRAERRTVPMADDEAGAIPANEPQPDPDRVRLLGFIMAALTAAVSRLPARERLRLASYYAQRLTLAQIGRLLGEHEATVSRQLARTRRTLREDVEQLLRHDMKLSDAEIQQCFEYAVADPGTLDLGELLAAADRKKSARTRSI
jgi:RNA polymerase sigma-70 factor (ECF subfamily)